MTATLESGVTSTYRIDKPWGHEIVWAVVEGSYVGKIIHVLEGQALSLQTHENKTETMYAIDGYADLYLGPTEDTLEKVVLSPQSRRSVTIPAGYVHRLAAVTDVTVLEVSTADPGWQNDVTRLKDNYAREGTSRP